jgi:hypothetical protein
MNNTIKWGFRFKKNSGRDVEINLYESDQFIGFRQLDVDSIIGIQNYSIDYLCSG